MGARIMQSLQNYNVENPIKFVLYRQLYGRPIRCPCAPIPNVCEIPQEYDYINFAGGGKRTDNEIAHVGALRYNMGFVIIPKRRYYYEENVLDWGVCEIMGIRSAYVNANEVLLRQMCLEVEDILTHERNYTDRSTDILFTFYDSVDRGLFTDEMNEMGYVPTTENADIEIIDFMSRLFRKILSRSEPKVMIGETVYLEGRGRFVEVECGNVPIECKRDMGNTELKHWRFLIGRENGSGSINVEYTIENGVAVLRNNTFGDVIRVDASRGESCW